MTRVLARLWKEESGQDLTEYALLLVLLVLAAVSTFGTLANSIGQAFLAAASNLSTAN
jgi:Flp pilus assembly pilin Flp